MKANKVKFFAVLFALVFLMGIAGCGKLSCPFSDKRDVPAVNVRGEGMVEIVPDEAIARFGVTSDEKTLSKAYLENTKNMNAVIEAVKRKGIDEKDIMTSSYRVIPVYPRDDSGRTVPGKPASYRVSQSLSVKIRQMEDTGTVIDEVISAGVNTFEGIQFVSSLSDEMEIEARVKAAENAKEKAASLAEALGFRLGRILSVSESSQGMPPVARMAAQDVSMLRTAPQIEPGTLEVVATCDVTYEIIQ